jgi:hypothetical protein
MLIVSEKPMVVHMLDNVMLNYMCSSTLLHTDVRGTGL